MKIYQHSHLGVAAAIAKVRLRFWICGLARIRKTNKYKCVMCRKRGKIFAAQRMGPLPKRSLKPSLP